MKKHYGVYTPGKEETDIDKKIKEVISEVYEKAYKAGYRKGYDNGRMAGWDEAGEMFNVNNDTREIINLFSWFNGLKD